MDEQNGIKVGDWTLDLFINEDGHLGVTVYEKGTDGEGGGDFIDIFVDKVTLEVTSG